MSNIETKSYSANITLMYLDSADLNSIDAALDKKLSQIPSDFFMAEPIVADISRIPNAEALNLSALKALFQRHHLSLVGINGSTFSDEMISEQGLAKFSINNIHQATTRPVEKPEPIPAPQKSPQVIHLPTQAPQNKVLRTNVRSGQQIYAQGGDLTIIGAVNAGAEVVADGNIYILGSLRGRAFAGAQGNDEAHIFANDFQAELISIAGNYQNHEQLLPYRGGKNCLITLNKDETMLIVSL